MSDDSSLSRRSFLSGVVASAVIAAVPATLRAQGANESSPWAAAKWFNEPRHWQMRDRALVCTADPKTDFWQKTFYGYSYDSGHFYHRPVKGDFTTTIKITGKYHDLYDQAGLMFRVDAANWMKCGVEFVDGRQNVSVVVTREFSDWSTARLP